MKQLYIGTMCYFLAFIMIGQLPEFDTQLIFSIFLLITYTIGFASLTSKEMNK